MGFEASGVFNMTVYPDGPRQLVALGILLVMIPFISLIALFRNTRRRGL